MPVAAVTSPPTFSGRRSRTAPSSSGDFEEFVVGQFPFRPHHPDFERLKEVVKQFEAWKADGVAPETAYASIGDIYSISYLAVQRAGMNAVDRASAQEILDLMANAWVEGFGHGVVFQQLGGRQLTDDDITGGA